MTNKPSLEKLVCAVAVEKKTLENSRQKNDEIFRKMIAYQQGCGPAPTIDEFLHWHNSMKQIVFEKKLDSGLMDL